MSPARNVAAASFSYESTYPGPYAANAAAPGSATHDLTAIVPGPTRADVTETVAVRRFRDAADVADLVTFLLSGTAAAISGNVLEALGAITL